MSQAKCHMLLRPKPGHCPMTGYCLCQGWPLYIGWPFSILWCPSYCTTYIALQQLNIFERGWKADLPLFFFFCNWCLHYRTTSAFYKKKLLPYVCLVMDCSPEVVIISHGRLLSISRSHFQNAVQTLVKRFLNMFSDCRFYNPGSA